MPLPPPAGLVKRVRIKFLKKALLTTEHAEGYKTNTHKTSL